MINPPAFQFYPKDFLADANVQAMTLEEIGAYMRLLCVCWIEDGIPVKAAPKMVDHWLSHPSAKGQPTGRLWLKIKHCFYQKDGKYRNRRLDLERKKQMEWSEKSRRGGLKRAEYQRLASGGSAKGQPKASQSQLSSLHLQSSSSIKEKKEYKPSQIGKPETQDPKSKASLKHAKEIRDALIEKAADRLKAAKTAKDCERIMVEIDEAAAKEINKGVTP